MPLVLTSRPLISELNSIVHNNLNILYLDLAVKTVFTSPQFVAFKG